MPQLFRYLRHLAVVHRLQTVYGVLTDYRQWFFVRFDLTAELEAAINGDGISRCFEVSRCYELLDQDFNVKEDVLGEVIHHIQWLIMSAQLC